MYLNPAFTGNLAKSSFYINARQQWPKINGAYVSSSFAANHRLGNINSGIGVIVKQDEEGAAKFTSTNLSGIYTYILNVNKEWTLSPGIQATYINSRVNQSTIVFGDQINDDFSVSNSTNDQLINEPKNNIDISSGLVIYNQNLWFGMSTHHLTEPNNFSNNGSSLQRKYSIHSGYQIKYKPLTSNEVIIFSPNINLNFQSEFFRVSTNISTTYHFFTFGTGISNITTSFSNKNILNSYILLGYSDDNFKVGYSYDFSVRGATGLGGAHEITIGILLNYDNNSNPNPLKHKKIRKVSCPKF